MGRFFNYGGDKLTGELHSPKFKITKRFLNFLVAGGSRFKVGVELWINDKKKLVSRGSNNENFTPKSWDLNSYLGYDAQIRLVDYETGGWGHIHADRFVLSSVPSVNVQQLPVPSLKEIERLLIQMVFLRSCWNHGAIISSKKRVYSLYLRISKKRRAYL